jgi:hypothetical protein
MSTSIPNSVIQHVLAPLLDFLSAAKCQGVCKDWRRSIQTTFIPRSCVITVNSNYRGACTLEAPYGFEPGCVFTLVNTRVLYNLISHIGDTSSSFHVFLRIMFDPKSSSVDQLQEFEQLTPLPCSLSRMILNNVAYRCDGQVCGWNGIILTNIAKYCDVDIHMVPVSTCDLAPSERERLTAGCPGSTPDSLVDNNILREKMARITMSLSDSNAAMRLHTFIWHTRMNKTMPSRRYIAGLSTYTHERPRCRDAVDLVMSLSPLTIMSAYCVE